METGPGTLDRAPSDAEYASHFSVAFNGTRDMMVLFRVESERTLRLLAANAQYLITLNSLGFQVTASDLTGRTLEEVCSKLGFPEGASRAMISRYVEVVKTREPMSLEERTETPRGPHYGETILTPVLDSTGLCTHVLYAARDITDRKLAEQALRESEVRLRQTFRATPVAMVIVELSDGRIVDGNLRSVDLFGLAESDQLAHSFERASDGERFLARMREGAPLRDEEALLKSASGRALTCLVSVEAIQLGGARCAVVAFHDVTRQREIEHEKAALEARLAHSQKLEALGTLAGGIAHDFNNILSAMVAYSDLTMLDAADPVLVREYAGELRRASDRAKELVGRILSFGRKTQPERRPIELGPIVLEASKLLRSSLPTSIDIRCEVAQEAGHVLADATQIHQIVMNLGTNAAHAMVGVPGILDIRLSQVGVADDLAHAVPGLKMGAFVLLEVNDSGHGMDEETLRRVFDPFFTTKAPGEGTGLGLAVVHGIVRESGGAIAVQSRVGAGSSFQLYFPVVDSLREISAPTDSVRSPGNGEHVLLLDDELTVGQSARLLLSRLGYRVSAFSNPLEALARFRDAPQEFSLVITDLTMPIMSGLEFAQEVLRTRPDTPVFVASGFSGALTEDRVRALGIRELVTKPFSIDVLATKIRAALSKA